MWARPAQRAFRRPRSSAPDAVSGLPARRPRCERHWHGGSPLGTSCRCLGRDERRRHTTQRSPVSTQPGPSEVPPCGCSVPGEAEPGVCYCSVADLLRVVRRRYSLSVLNVVHARGSARFHDLEATLGGASTSTLTETLNALLAARLLSRAEPADGSHRAPYSITPAGEKLLRRLRRLLDEVQGG